MVKVINAQTLPAERKENGFAMPRFQMFHGSTRDLRGAETWQNVPNGPLLDPQVIKMATLDYARNGRTEMYRKIRNLQQKALNEMGVKPGETAQNAAHAPSYSTLSSLVSLIFQDMTRRYMESPDFTDRIVTETVNADFRETVTTREIKQYRGVFEQFSAEGDPVPLIDQALAETDTFSLSIYGLGWATTLKNILFNEFHSMQKVIDAVTAGYVDKRNNLIIGTIVGTSFDSSQEQPAATSGSTYEENMYITFRNAIQLLRTLLDNNTDRKISVPSISLLCNSNDTWYIERVINGYLSGMGGDATRGVNNSALPINEIIEYDQGANNGFVVGKKTISMPGVTAGTCYLFVPREYAWVATKRGLTMESSMGSALTLSKEERAWYFVQGQYLKDFLGSSYSGAGTSGYGAIVEVTLPTPNT